jgi:ketosteroid isomerase-like protein
VSAREGRLETVAALFRAFGEFDRDEFVSHLTEDVDFRPSAFLTGTGEMHGREAVSRDLTELAEQLERSGERVRLHPLAFYVDREDEDLVLALGRLTIIRPTGDAFDTEVAYLHRMAGDKVAELHTWLDHKRGLSQLGDPEQVPIPD